ncbi:hypothetical protein PGT21_008104 [Puccinia graminis f. sp. tritici]|uniref:Uncharacterized protein n=1 Tax=Puccinia graminis f. sp. tritici TaxID=56615 RepID=A0A5B0LZP2_PUCGR|nr:hypothetical protein PGT21_008104 [Puccinia graminis f. sp. tritici]
MQPQETTTTKKRPHSALSTTLLRPRRSSIEDDLKQRRLSGWAIFESVIDHHHSSSSSSSSSSASGRNNLTSQQEQAEQQQQQHNRLSSPTRPICQEPQPIDYQQQTQPTPSSKSKLISFANSAFSKLPSSFRRDFRVILKCSIAYLIASLFSFYDPLSDLLVLPFGLDGPFSGAHVVATIVTYYRPAATVGGMIEANHHAIWGLFWLAVIIVGSTLTSFLIENRIISHAIILIFFVGFGYGSMAWVKLKSPGFASTCSMIIVISSVIITREGSIHFGFLDRKCDGQSPEGYQQHPRLLCHFDRNVDQDLLTRRDHLYRSRASQTRHRSPRSLIHLPQRLIGCGRLRVLRATHPALSGSLPRTGGLHEQAGPASDRAQEWM